MITQENIPYTVDEIKAMVKTCEKYNKALERARQFSEHPLLEDSANIVEYIFPELAESEDERIRKEILNAFKQLDEGTTICGRNYDYAKWIAWLEKQQPFDKDKVAKEFLRSIAISIINWFDVNIPEDKMCLSNIECEDIENAVRNADWNKIYAYMKKKLEKQEEQTQLDYEHADIPQKDFALIEHKTLNADKVIEWLEKNILLFWDWNTPFSPIKMVKLFKKDFEL